MQDFLNDRSVVLVTRAAHISADVLAALMRAALRQVTGPKQGRQSVRDLTRGGAVSNIEITDANILAFNPVARKYGINYALQKDDSVNPPRWLVYFRARDVDAMTSAFKEFTERGLRGKHMKPSVRDKMRDLSEQLRDTVVDRTKRMIRGGHEL